jgi:hypothetical protein
VKWWRSGLLGLAGHLPALPRIRPRCQCWWGRPAGPLCLQKTRGHLLDTGYNPTSVLERNVFFYRRKWISVLVGGTGLLCRNLQGLLLYRYGNDVFVIGDSGAPFGQLVNCRYVKVLSNIDNVQHMHCFSCSNSWGQMIPYTTTCFQDLYGCPCLTYANYQLPITKWPHQSEAPVGAAPPTRSQLRLQRQT